MKLGELRNWLWSEGAPMKRNWLAAVLYVVAALALLASQMVGYIIKCCGFEGFQTPRIMPLMINDTVTNLVYLVMVVLILPPQFSLISDPDDDAYLFDEEEDLLEDEEAAAFEQLLSRLAMEETEENT